METIDEAAAEVTQNFDGIQNSAAWKRVIRQVEVVAPTDATVLILENAQEGIDCACASPASPRKVFIYPA